jgi:hypothetical protein
MFRTLLNDRATRFDKIVRAALVALAFVFTIGVAFGVLDLGTSPDQIAETSTITFEVISIQTLLPDIGGSLANLPTLRF